MRIVGGNDNQKSGQKRGGRTLVLDEHRGMRAQKETDLRRRRSGVRADQEALRENRDALEKHLFAKPAESWSQAAEKADYLLRLFATTAEAQDPRYKRMIASVLDDLQRMDGDAPKPAR